jgi:hypothetical protein
MKGFYFALALLAGVVLLVAINAAFVIDTQASLSRTVEALSPVPSEVAIGQIRALREQFESKETKLSFSINYYLLDRIKELLASLEAYAASGDTPGYTSTHQLLRDTIQDLSRLETISWMTIS